MEKGTYPTDKQLINVERWDLIEDSENHNKLYTLLDYVKNLWEYPDRFYIGKSRKHKFMKNKRIRTLYLSTGGWSGNESIIGSLHKNFIFWSMYWYKEQRGGHYWFEIPPKRDSK
jgi:hypothetical protein